MATPIIDAIQKHRMHHPWKCGDHVAKGLANALRISDSLFLLSKGLACTVEEDAARTLQRCVRGHLAAAHRGDTTPDETTSGSSTSALARGGAGTRTARPKMIDVQVVVMARSSPTTEASESPEHSGRDVGPAGHHLHGGVGSRGDWASPETEDPFLRASEGFKEQNDSQPFLRMAAGRRRRSRSNRPTSSSNADSIAKLLGEKRRRQRREHIKHRRRLVRTRIRRLLYSCSS